MITLITGAPGAGKSAALVDMLLELGKGRAIYTNGIPDLKMPHLELEHVENWMTDVPDGSIVVVDEVQRVWRPRGPGKKVPEDVAKLETHRHRGLDFYIVTQGPNLVDANVRALVGRHVHLRELGILGRWWYEWPECCDQCRTAWRGAPIKKRYKLPRRVFDQYKSASMHIKPVRSIPRSVVLAVVAVVGAASLSFYGYKRIRAQVAPEKPAAVAQVAGSAAGVHSVAAPVAAPAPKVVDERVDFIPRVLDRPWTAPAYDDLRKVVSMPQIAGGICKGAECKCYDASAVRLDVSADACRKWIERPEFNPYQVAQQAAPAPAMRAPTEAGSGRGTQRRE